MEIFVYALAVIKMRRTGLDAEVTMNGTGGPADRLLTGKFRLTWWSAQHPGTWV